MTGKIDWGNLFFSAVGRIRQLHFLIGGAVLLLLLCLYDSAVKGALQFVTGWIVYPILLGMGACVLSKRLHDRGRSGWWSAVILLAVIMVWPAPTGFFDFIAVLVLIWAVIDLGVMPGERGDNRYGRTLFRLKPREQS
ncbi:DUF805 domain-containing protein [Asticcacaulis solisilvae]|uniref:DUF805 domain-containing protein n=1 Tax=Asticcacaulis solisilvae TaxID=1217274 RepID=UPI003FD7A5CE